MSYIFKKGLSLSIFYSKCGHEYEKIFEKEEPIEILKVFALINKPENIRKYIIISEENISQ